ncbi:LPXTG cell wall anchor domain-containing protein [Eubacterium barkeri]|uniref:LPXTG-motif cell wall anchor domain-containing protein n=1 Tax=Eubacterium barkeri TaxID=1528 RepID=A0A1H3GPP2_EUBBA|nr:LPXTG cell wall anchor domain-containing protein [Eubacterium barkeri]SDY04598.1 LPXTG-motif cell wall anchor domain-containing protein [Eubacterium barkeri]
MKKQCIPFILTAVFLLATMGTVLAEGGQVITFKGEAEKFVQSVDGNLSTEGFMDLQPGEERTLNLILKNDGAREMSFYMSAEILDNIAEKTADSQAVYDFSIAKNGTTFFSTVIGGGSAYNQSVGREYLQEDNDILMDTLAVGAQDRVTVAIKLDGQSAENSYMDKTGKIQLVFSAGYPVTPGQSMIKTVTQYITGERSIVNTGVGGVSMAAIIGVVLIILAVVLIVKRRRREE